MDMNQKTIIPDSVMFRELEGETVLMNLETENYYSLNEMGTEIWKTLEKSTSIEHAYEAILAEYDVEPGELLEDMTSLIDNLVERKLLIIS